MELNVLMHIYWHRGEAMISDREVELNDIVLCLDFFVALKFVLTKSSTPFSICLLVVTILVSRQNIIGTLGNSVD